MSLGQDWPGPTVISIFFDTKILKFLPGCFEVAQYIWLLPPSPQTKKEKKIKKFEKNLEHILRVGLWHRNETAKILKTSKNERVAKTPWSWGRTHDFVTTLLHSFGRAQDRIPAPTREKTGHRRIKIKTQS